MKRSDFKTYLVTFKKKDNTHLLEIKISHYDAENVKIYIMGILGIKESRIKKITLINNSINIK